MAGYGSRRIYPSTRERGPSSGFKGQRVVVGIALVGGAVGMMALTVWIRSRWMDRPVMAENIPVPVLRDTAT